MKIKFTLIVAIIVLLCPKLPAAAEVTLREGATASTIKFYGDIDSASVKKLSELLQVTLRNAKDDSRPLVLLRSDGGSVEAAIAGGRAIRQALATVLVEFGSGPGVERPGCASACVFLYAAGVERITLGGIGIHNPFVVSTSGTYDDIRGIRQKMDTQARSFLTEMNVSPSLFDKMLAVPSNKIRILPPAELEELGLRMFDPTFEDYRIGKAASKFGIGKAEYMTRVNQVQRKCGAPPKGPTLPSVESMTEDRIREFVRNEEEYKSQEPKLWSQWNSCGEAVLSGRSKIGNN